jgi:hypothetical protein
VWRKPDTYTYTNSDTYTYTNSDTDAYANPDANAGGRVSEQYARSTRYSDY